MTDNRIFRKPGNGKERSLHAGRLMAALVYVLLLLLLITRFFDFYFDLNDDFMIQHLLSGAYTGTPESRDIQNLYPFSLAVSGLYRIFPETEWYGGFLVLCQLGCAGIVLWRIAGTGSGKGRRLRLLAAGLMIPALLLYHMVFIQYSVTVGILAGTACILILTMKKAAGVREYLRRLLPTMVLLWAGYILRSEMLLFLLPFVLLALLWRIMRDCGMKAVATIRVIAMPAAALTAVIAALQLSDAIACKAPAWQEFRAFFDARTQLYDFQLRYLPSYEEDPGFYAKAGMSEEEAALLKNYNFGLDDTLDAGKLAAVADLAAQRGAALDPPAQRLRNAVWTYRHLPWDRTQLPWSMITAACYVLALAAVLERFYRRRAGAGQWKEPLWDLICMGFLAAGRSVLWLYLLYHARPVTRLTHPMYMMECILLTWTALRDDEDMSCPDTAMLRGEDEKCRYSLPEPSSGIRVQAGKRQKHSHMAVRAAVLTAVLAAGIVMQLAQTNAEYVRREGINVRYQAFLDYCAARPEALILTDVYSTVDFSEKIFDNNKVTVYNWDLLGGWVCKSPLQKKRLALSGQESMAQALVQTDKEVYYAASSEYDTGWLADLYNSKEMPVNIEVADYIADYFTVYRILPAGDVN